MPHSAPRLFLFALTLLALPCSSQTVPANAAYKNTALPTPQRVQDLLSRMTLEEKVSMLAGSAWMESTAVARLGIPAIKMADGPMGIRIWTGPSAETNKTVEGQVRTFSSTAFPAGINLAASWDPDLARQEGKVIAQEVASVGRDMILGPTVNIQRTPLWGRNFESFGEDPFLAGKIAVGYIQGVQSEGILPSVKHFTVNNQEFERHRIDVAVSERALHEIYFPAFEAAIQQAHVWTVMSSYNKVNGIYAAESPLLKKILYDEFGFQGLVISDWGSTYSTAATVNAGMDLEMPGGPQMVRWLTGASSKEAGNDGGYLVPAKVLPQIENRHISPAAIDQNVEKILNVVVGSGLFDHPHPGGTPIDTPPQRALTRRAAQEGIVLLKNQNHALPLDKASLHSIAVIGPAAQIPRAGGGGSGLVYAQNVVSPLEGIRNHAGNITVGYALGVPMEGEKAPQSSQDLLAEAVKLARTSDVAIVCIGYSSRLETEGKDRPNMDLPAGQDQLVRAIAAANKHTIVVLNAGDSVTLTQWIEQVPALIDAWYGGEEGGSALADILFGDVDPSGKLPFTFLRKLQDSPSYGHYPGKLFHVELSEGIYVGYRYFDQHPQTAPLFPFGFGLSYTRFTLGNLHIPKQIDASGQASVSVSVRNSGTLPGAEVVQLYIGDPAASVDRPLRELKGFERVQLAPGESKTLTFPLDRRAFSFYSESKHAWIAEPGRFDISVGSSSRDLPLKGSLQLLP